MTCASNYKELFFSFSFFHNMLFLWDWTDSWPQRSKIRPILISNESCLHPESLAKYIWTGSSSHLILLCIITLSQWRHLQPQGTSAVQPNFSLLQFVASCIIFHISLNIYMLEVCFEWGKNRSLAATLKGRAVRNQKLFLKSRRVLKCIFRGLQLHHALHALID